MRKKVFGKKLSRDYGSRRALARSLIRALILHGTIKTTKAKAKAIQPEVEKMVTLAKKGGIPQRRQVYAMLGGDRKITDGLFGKVAPAFINRLSGYTRIVNLPQRQGDAAKMARLEWSQKIEIESKKDRKLAAQKTQKETLKAQKKTQ